MIKLVNGKGQLGSAITEISKTYDGMPVSIYHTWNVADKSKLSQLNEYEKFTKYIDEHKNSKDKIVFISSASENDTWYTYYKQRAEAYLLMNYDNCMILRLPTFIGKPCKLFEPNAKAWGNVELISIKTAAQQILEHIKLQNNKNRIFYIKGETISAQLVVDILKTK